MRQNKYTDKYYERHPWMVHYWSAYSRCNNPSTPAYKYYGQVGIKFYLTELLIKRLWRRDGADKMKRPSIDRIDSSGDYSYSNCRFIEHNENCRSTCKAVKQYSLSGRFIKVFDSAASVERELGFNRHNINRCCLGKRPTAFGYKWQYTITEEK